MDHLGFVLNALCLVDGVEVDCVGVGEIEEVVECFDCFRSLLFVAEDQVNPVVEVIGHIV